MDRYTIKLLPKAYRDLDEIYEYISSTLLVSETAINTIEAIEDAIFSLEEPPYRGSERKTGVYAYQGYRQLFVKNFTIIYRIDEAKKYVVIVTIKYSMNNF